MGEEARRKAVRARLDAAVEGADRALRDRWEREGADAAAVYAVDMPAQSLTVKGDERARAVIRDLKALGVRGTYRIVGEGGGRKEAAGCERTAG